MTIMEGLGDGVSLVLSLYEGKNFNTQCLINKNADGAEAPLQLVAVADLNSEEIQTSDAIELDGSEPFINTEFDWSMARQHFQAMRSRKVMLKVQFFVSFLKTTENNAGDSSDRKLLGILSFDLREATPLIKAKQLIASNSSEFETTYEIHSKWKNLINAKNIPGRPAPSMKCALVLEPNSHRLSQNIINLEHQECDSNDTSDVFLQETSKESKSKESTKS